jgi:hypothetical protein
MTCDEKLQWEQFVFPTSRVLWFQVSDDDPDQENVKIENKTIKKYNKTKGLIIDGLDASALHSFLLP